MSDQEPSWMYQSPDGTEYGPYSDSELRTYAAQGRVVANGFVRQVGQTDWTPAMQVIQSPQIASPRAFNPPLSPEQIVQSPRSTVSRASYILLGLLPGILISIFGINNLVAGYVGKGVTQLLLSIMGNFVEIYYKY